MEQINPKYNKLVPRATANNGYDLCLEVIDTMLAEPKRVDMGYFCLLVGQGEKYHGHREMAPACGTVGCFAGWINTITFGRSVSVDHTANLAKRVLGTKLSYYFKDAHGKLRGYFNAGEGDGIASLRAGTPEYAIAVVQRIRKFMRVNAKALKARRIDARVKAAALKGAF